MSNRFSAENGYKHFWRKMYELVNKPGSTLSWRRGIDKARQSPWEIHKQSNTVFRAGLYKLISITDHLRVKLNTQEKFYNLQTTSNAICCKTKTREGTGCYGTKRKLKKKRFQQVGTPIVPIIKLYNTVRVSRDYKVILNPCLEVQHYLG